MSPAMVVESFYLSDENNVNRLVSLCELCEDEVEEIVGRFKNDHYRFAGLLKGEVLVGMDGKVEIRHHFKKSVLWRSND